MTDPTLPYATKPAPFSGLTIIVADDQVELTTAPPRGVVLGALTTVTIMYAALWTMLFNIAVKIISMARRFGDSSIFWYGIATIAVPALAALLVTVGSAVGWWRYWRVGPVPIHIRVTQEGLLISKMGMLRAVSANHFPPEVVRSVDVRPVRGSLTRKPLCEIVIRMRRRFPLTIRTTEPIDGAPRAFVDGAKRLLNLHR